MNFLLLTQHILENVLKGMACSLAIIGHEIEPVNAWGNVLEIKVLGTPVRCRESHGDAVFRARLILGQL
jgi:hypothetical protein